MDKIIGFFKNKEGPMEQILKLDKVIVDNDLNPRQGALDQDVVLDYSAHVDDLPPMVAFDVQGFYFLVGGFHRYAAHRLAQRSEGHFIVYQGDRSEAKEFADLDNLKHGLRLNRAERRAVIERQLKRHPEWSDTRLASVCYTTDKTVRAVREQLEQTSEIPRLDILVGADGIERPRTISQPPRQPADPPPELLRPVEEMEAQQAFEGVVSIEDGYVNIVREGQAVSVPLSEFEAEPGATPITDAVMALPEEDKDIAINTPAVYEAMHREQVAAGLADDTPAWLRDDDPVMQPDLAAGLDRLAADLAAYTPPVVEAKDDETEVESETVQMGDAVGDTPATESVEQVDEGVDVGAQELESAVRVGVGELSGELPSVSQPSQLPVPVAPAPPPPGARAAPWVASISVPEGDAPPLVTVLHGNAPKSLLPADVARRMIAAIEARIEPPPAVKVSDDVPVAAPDWLNPAGGIH